MGKRFTTLGGNRPIFPTTHWSCIMAAPGRGDGAARAAMEALARTYWKPVYAYMRTQWAKSDADAKDLTQEFFLWMMESRFLAEADPAKGRFRGFVKSALKFYLMDEHRKRGRIKRGGGRKFLSMEFESDGDRLPDLEDPAKRAPEDVLDDVWRSEILGRATELLERALVEEGREVQFRVFEDYFLSESGKMIYKEVAEKYGITTVNVSDYLMAAKRKFRSILIDLVSETVRGEEELKEEWSMLFGEGP